MHYLVDAYNLLFRALKKRGPLEKSRQRMIEELNAAVSKVHLQVTLVFDGAEYSSRGHFDAIELIYTPKSITADEYISEEVIRSKTPSQITVVTNDRELASRCRDHRAKTLNLDAFIALIAKKKKKKRAAAPQRGFKESDAEIARLLTIFEKKLSEELKE